MLRAAKILLPVDFSERSERAVRYALPFASHFRAELILLHVLAPHYEIGMVEGGGAGLGELVDQRRAKARQAVDEFLSAELERFSTRRMLLEGDPATEIVAFAHGELCDWIVMPTHGYGPFRRLLLGSVTAKVLHDADCAVLTGAHIETEPSSERAALRHVVCAVNLSESSPRVLAWAAQMAGEFNACLTVVHVLESLQPATEGYLLSPEWRSQTMDRAEAEVAALQRKVGTAAAVALETGNAAEALCAEVRARGADLLVIGRSSQKGMLGRLTERAYAIIRQSPCPVASV